MENNQFNKIINELNIMDETLMSVNKHKDILTKIYMDTMNSIINSYVKNEISDQQYGEFYIIFTSIENKIK